MRTVKSAMIEGWMKEFAVTWMMHKGELIFHNRASQKVMAVCDICSLPLMAMEKKEGAKTILIELSCPMGHGEIVVSLPTKNKKKKGAPPPKKIVLKE